MTIVDTILVLFIVVSFVLIAYYFCILRPAPETIVPLFKRINPNWGCRHGKKPNFGNTVYVISPDDITSIFPANDVTSPAHPTAFQQLQRILLTQNSGEFFNEGHGEGIMVYFLPGQYSKLELRLGYYMEAKGLGANPGDVSFTDSVVYSTGVGNEFNQFSCDPACGNADNVFKRGIANLSLQVPGSFGTYNHGLLEGALEWAVSQQSPWRSLHIIGNLRLTTSGGSSAFQSSMFGGPDSIVTGQLQLNGQQQYCLRNAEVGSVNAGPSQRYTFLGCKTGQSALGPSTPVIREIPYLCIMENAWTIVVPTVVRNKSGAVQDYSEARGNCTLLSADTFYAVHPSDSITVVQQQLNDGQNLFILPGIHKWTTSLVIDSPNVIILGIGQPRIRGTSGLFHLTSKATNCTLASMIIEAGESDNNKTLLISDATTPGEDEWTVFFDVMFSIGGYTSQHVYLNDWVVKIGSSQTILDGIWCWGADHGVPGYGGAKEIYDSVQPSKGIQVNGGNCYFYGLCIEHMNDGPFFEVNGANCSVYGYMSELTYYLINNYTQPIIHIGKNASNFSLVGWNFYTFTMHTPMPATSCCVYDETGNAHLPNDSPGKINDNPCTKHVSCTTWP